MSSSLPRRPGEIRAKRAISHPGVPGAGAGRPQKFRVTHTQRFIPAEVHVSFMQGRIPKIQQLPRTQVDMILRYGVHGHAQVGSKESPLLLVSACDGGKGCQEKVSLPEQLRPAKSVIDRLDFKDMPAESLPSM